MPDGGSGMMWAWLAVVVLFLADTVRNAWLMREQNKRIDTLTRILASRNYVEFARAERILATGEKPKTHEGDGYTEAFQ